MEIDSSRGGFFLQIRKTEAEELHPQHPHDHARF